MQPLLPEEIELAEAELAEMLETGGDAGTGGLGSRAESYGDPLGGSSGTGFGSPEDDDLPGSEPFEPSSAAGRTPIADVDDLPELPAPDEDLPAGFGGPAGEGDLDDLPPLPAPDEDLPGSGPESGSGFGGLAAEPWTTDSGGPLEAGEDDPLGGDRSLAASTPFLCFVNLFLAKHYCHLYQQTGEVAYLKRCRYYYARFVRCRG